MTGESTDEQIEALLGQGADHERRFLRRERRAERDVAELRAKLGDDEARLERANRRAERSRSAVAAAEEILRQRQAERANGPTSPDGTGSDRSDGEH